MKIKDILNRSSHKPKFEITRANDDTVIVKKYNEQGDLTEKVEYLFSKSAYDGEPFIHDKYGNLVNDIPWIAQTTVRYKNGVEVSKTKIVFDVISGDTYYNYELNEKGDMTLSTEKWTDPQGNSWTYFYNDSGERISSQAYRTVYNDRGDEIAEIRVKYNEKNEITEAIKTVYEYEYDTDYDMQANIIGYETYDCELDECELEELGLTTDEGSGYYSIDEIAEGINPTEKQIEEVIVESIEAPIKDGQNKTVDDE